jgi:hypothetical protein
MEGWASIKNAAKYADISVRTMRGMLKRGLKHSRLSSGMIRIRYNDIDEFFMQYQVSENQIDKIIDEVLSGFTRKSK